MKKSELLKILERCPKDAEIKIYNTNNDSIHEILNLDIPTDFEEIEKKEYFLVITNFDGNI